MPSKWSPASRRRLLQKLPANERRELRQKVATLKSFAAGFLGVNLRPYQVEAGDAILRSILARDGNSFVLLFARQSGKDELIANLILYLLARLGESGVSIVCAQPTFRPQTVIASDRLQARASQRPFFSLGGFHRSHGFVFDFLSARVTYLSADPSASVVGATADRLLIINEAQDVQSAIYDKRFAPMAASGNATRVFSGTAWTGDTLLDREMRVALQEEKRDGIRRLFVVDGAKVARSNRLYAGFLQQEISKLGREHPLIRTQYFCENIDARSSMFSPAHRALMQPGDPRGAASHPVAFLLDVAGQEASSMSHGSASAEHRIEPQLNYFAERDISKIPHAVAAGSRDAVTLRIVEVDLSMLQTLQGPTYWAVYLQQWTGQNHLTVFGQIKALAESWHPQRIVIDATGVGEGLWAMLDKAFPERVIPVKFTQAVKSELGYGFLAIINTGRFRDYCLGERAAGQALMPGRAQIDREYAACESEILIGPQKTMRWGVPDGRRDQDGLLIHDDIPVTDSLTAILDRLEWHVHSPSHIIQAPDPLVEIDRRYRRGHARG